MIHDKKQVNLLYQQVQLEREAINSLKAAVHDEGKIRKLKTPAGWLDDVEHYFLGSLEKEDRTKEQESAWLFDAAKLLHMAINERTRLQGLMGQLGRS